ncbi:hypothetical protein KFK09_026289 [Dendrobium nobile]|uniref:Reverse transcriptase zinc-binding domain-containing protein n=1 Tax=Dendrobium nobile TaxID=94219 RepID=A0A8T3A7T1_DENNO|nr:hypothetical protein KFK09_026289 [Dendrobium nobile]
MKDAWIMDKSLLKWPTFVGSFDDENLKLDYFIEDGKWDFMKLRQCFGEDLVRMIGGVQIFNSLLEEQMELKLQLTGKSISALLMEDGHNDVMKGDTLTWIQKLKTNARVELFLWRICRDAIPTEEFLYRRRIFGNCLSHGMWCDQRSRSYHF